MKMGLELLDHFSRGFFHLLFDRGLGTYIVITAHTDTKQQQLQLEPKNERVFLS